jgi:GTP-binding protein
LAKISETDRRELFFVDLPGYGYARTCHSARHQWANFIEEYFLKSLRLKLVCQLIDIRHAPMPSDIATYRWLIANNIPVQVVATKVDKLTRMTINKHVEAVKSGIGLFEGQVIAYSSAKGTGREELLDVIAHILLE